MCGGGGSVVSCKEGLCVVVMAVLCHVERGCVWWW